MSFSIDDVRDTFSRDIGACLAGVDSDARELVSSISQVRLEAAASFAKVEDRFHTIFGTTMLVGATSIANVVAELEAMCRRGEAALREMRKQERRAAEIAALCVESSGALQKMLALELDHRREDAQRLSTDLLTNRISSVREALAGLDKVESVPVRREEFAFADADEAAPVDEELREVFLAEAATAVADLERLLPKLAQMPDDFATAGNVERLFHTLKGASASIGLLDVSAVALELQARMERALEGDVEIDGAFLRTVVDDTNRFLSLAGLPSLRRSVVPHVDTAPKSTRSKTAQEFSFAEPEEVVKDELLSIFQQEAREAVGVLREHVQALVEDPNDLAAVAHMERIFHTLKGAASTVNLSQVVTAAIALQDRLSSVLESGAVVDQPFLDALFAKIDELLVAAGLGDLTVRAKTAGVRGPKAVPARVFLAEATQICRRALAIEEELANASNERTGELRAELTRLFHRLKGSALVGAHGSVAAEAERLQGLAGLPGALRAREMNRGVHGIAATLAIDLTGVTDPSQGSADASFELVREAVQLIAEPSLLSTMHQECVELLDASERILLDLETHDQPRTALENLLRHYHTLKGAVNTAGLSPTGAELHLVEDFLEDLRDKAILPSMKGVATFLFEVQNDVRRHLRQSAEGYVDVSLPRVRAAMARAMAGGIAEETSHLSLGGDGESRGSAGTGGGGALNRGDRAYIRVATERLDGLMNLAGELVVSRSRLMSRVTVLRGLQQELGRSSRRLVDTVDRFRDEHEFSLASGGQGRARHIGGVERSPAPAPDTMQGAPWNAFSELELDRYDDVNVLSRSLAEITNDVNEMNAQLVRELLGFADDSDAFGTIVSGIQTEVTRSRMIHLDLLFTRLRYPVRDAAERERKDVRVVCRGEEVSLDKTIADALFSPMLHLVRNAVVHGIESADVRASRGKSPGGVVTLTAREQAGQIIIEVTDDGGGLDLAELRARGAAMHLVAANTPLTDPSIKDLVFAAGLSTKATAGAVSGRGVGCDVVRRSIERLNGTLRVETTPGKGTTFTMTLPVTLSITRALLVRHGGRSFAIPLFFSERILDPEEANIVESVGVRRVRLDDTYAPIRRLGEVFQSVGEEAQRGPLLILRVGDERIVLQVDGLVGQEEIVVKGMGNLYSGHPLFAGVTIRGSGELVLILDVPALVERRNRAERGDAGGSARHHARNDEEGAVSGVVDALAGREASNKSVTELAFDTPPPAVGPGREAPTPPRASTFGPTGAGARPRVLFVDDSLSVRRVAEKALLSLGTDVTIAVDGADALAKLRDSRFDIVFTDLEMPRVHGYDLIRELRFIPAYKNLPIIVVSSRSGKKHQDQARALGASEYLTKPFSPKSLEAMLVRFCGEAAVAPVSAGGDQLEVP